MTQTMAPRRPKASEQAVETPPPALDPPALLADLHIDTDRMMLEGLDTSEGPLFSVSEMATFFFARSAHWVRWLEGEGRMVLDGKEVTAIRTKSNARKYDLTLVERIAHGLAANGTIDGQQLRYALLLVKIQAVMHGHLGPTRP